MKKTSKFLICELLIFLLILTGCASGNENDTVESFDSDNSVQMAEEEQNELPDQTATEQETSDSNDIADNQDAAGQELTGNQDVAEQELPDNQDVAPDLSGLSEEVIRQLEVFAENKDVWNVKETPREFYYAVFDIDNDGRLELITSAIAGTGDYSENHFYRTDDTFTKIEELPQEYYEEYTGYNGILIKNELDIYSNYDYGLAYTDGEVIYYPASDFNRDGFSWYYNADGAYYVKDGIVYSVIYRSDYILCKDEQQSWYDAAGNEITQETWEKLYDDFFAGMESTPYRICWNDIVPSELEQTSEQKIFSALVENYKDGLGRLTR